MFNVVGGKTSQIVVLGWVMGHGGALHVPCLEGFDSPHGPPKVCWVRIAAIALLL